MDEPRPANFLLILICSRKNPTRASSGEIPARGSASSSSVSAVRVERRRLLGCGVVGGVTCVVVENLPPCASSSEKSSSTLSSRVLGWVVDAPAESPKVAELLANGLWMGADGV